MRTTLHSIRCRMHRLLSRVLPRARRLRLQVDRMTGVALLGVRGQVVGGSAARQELHDACTLLSGYGLRRVIVDLRGAVIRCAEDLAEFMILAYNALPRDAEHRLMVPP